MDIIQELKSQVSIVDVVGHYRPLEKAGKNFKALCPFHDDHKPSMVVNPDQNFAWCFSCQNGGDIFSFVQKIEGVDFPQSVKIVGEIGGIDTSAFFSNSNPEKTKEKKEYKKVLEEILVESKKFFQTQLENHNQSKEYVFEKRKFSGEIVEMFEIGYAPDEFHTLENYLISKKFSRKQILDSGMAKTKDTNGEKIFDAFRGRVVFPVYDSQGSICGFGGRVLDDQVPKYLNSPQTQIYDKSSILFGFSKARETIRKENMAILVEGNFDVMTCHQFGITNAVGVSGTGFTATQAKILKRFCNRVTLALDSDTAGIEASKRVLEILYANGFTVHMMEIPGGKDPDESLHDDSQKFIEAIDSAPIAFSRMFDIFSAQFNVSSSHGKREVFEKLFPLVVQMPEDLEKKECLDIISKKFALPSEIVEESFQKFKAGAFTHTKNIEPKKLSVRPEVSQSEYFFGVLCALDAHRNIIFERVKEEFFSDPAEKDLYKRGKTQYTQKEAFCVSEFLETCPPQMRENIQKASLYAQEKLSLLPPSQQKAEVIRMVNQIGKSLLESNIKLCTKEIRTNPSQAALEKLQQLTLVLKNFH